MFRDFVFVNFEIIGAVTVAKLVLLFQLSTLDEKGCFVGGSEDIFKLSNLNEKGWKTLLRHCEVG